jgi:hypothetical protein
MLHDKRTISAWSVLGDSNRLIMRKKVDGGYIETKRSSATGKGSINEGSTNIEWNDRIESEDYTL